MMSRGKIIKVKIKLEKALEIEGEKVEDVEELLRRKGQQKTRRRDGKRSVNIKRARGCIDLTNLSLRIGSGGMCSIKILLNNNKKMICATVAIEYLSLTFVSIEMTPKG